MERQKRPSYQWYPGDLRRDSGVQACSFYARALWREMLDLMHDGEPYGHLTAGGVAIDETTLARIVGVKPAQVRLWVAELEARKVFSRTDNGVIYSRRMVRDEHIRNVRADAGKKGGNPALMHKHEDNLKVKQPDNQNRKQNPTPAVAVAVASAKEPSSSSSSAGASEPTQPIRESTLAESLETDADRGELAVLLARAPSKIACASLLAMMLNGGQGQPVPTRREMGRAIADFNANACEWSAAHFRGYVLRAIAAERAPPASSRASPTGSGRNEFDAAVDAAAERDARKQIPA